MYKTGRFLLTVWFLVFGLVRSVAAEEALCAVVKIQISQELTLERQAFEATMRITNTLDTVALDDVKVALSFETSEGDTVIASSDPNHPTARFFIRLDDYRGIDGIQQGLNGAVIDGEVAPGGVAELQWLLIPAKGSAGPEGTLYLVGASLTYTTGGEEQEIVVEPDTIIVKPQPDLILDYFLPEDVIGDNPFTAETEAPEPYTLGIRVLNVGAGTARNVHIESAQPKIVENRLGLDIGFTILGSYVGNQPSSKSLKMNFGDIAPDRSVIGRWIMETTLSGRFTEFNATVAHADELGGALTSLVSEANTHWLRGDVIMELAGRDAVPDYLARADDKFIVYESEPVSDIEGICQDCSWVSTPAASLGGEENTAAGLSRMISISSPPASGPMYIRVPDPYQGSRSIARVVAADGRILSDRNAWLAKKLSEDGKSYEHYIDVFASQPASGLRVYFRTGPTANLPPVFRAVSFKTTFEGNQLGFLVKASDPEGTDPVLTVDRLPAGAEFRQDGAGQAVFVWTPQIGQAGRYELVFSASDGVHVSRMPVTIQVNPHDDKDGDGLNDAWELEQFGDLSHDGTADTDGDGLTDLQEYLAGSNPNQGTVVPSRPEIRAPLHDSRVSTDPVELVISNSRHDASVTPSYRFEVYADELYSRPVFLMAEVPQGSEETHVTLDPAAATDAALWKENGRYFWRVRAETPVGNSEWAYASFRLNQQNDAPLAPVFESPSDAAIVPAYRPEVVLKTVAEPDGDPQTVTVQVDRLDWSGNPVERVEIAEGLTAQEGTVRWMPASDLQEDTAYLITAWVKDDQGLASDEARITIVVNTRNDAPDVPVALAPAAGAETAATVSVRVSNSRDPEGDALSYQFQLDTEPTFDTADLRDSGWVSEEPEQTHYTFEDLTENQVYYWRARAFDGSSASDWTTGHFRVNEVNESPGPVTVKNPGAGAIVETAQPLLEVVPPVDPDADQVFYQFEILDADGTPVAQSEYVDTPAWRPDTALEDNSFYSWRVRVRDEHGLETDWSSATQFFVNVGGVDDAPTLTFTEPSQPISQIDGDVRISWTDTDPDSDARITLIARAQDGYEIVLAAGLSEDVDEAGDLYTWSLSGVRPGTYSIHAVIEDDANRVEVDACCSITVLPREGHVLATVVSGEMDEWGIKTAQVQLTLNRAPMDGETVRVNVSVHPSDEAMISRINDRAGATSLVFDASDWNQPQSIWLRGKDDCDVDGDQTVSLQILPLVSGDSGFDGVNPADVALVNRDNEVPGQHLVICGVQVVSKTPDGAGGFRIEIRPRLKNTGPLVYSPVATVESLDADLAVEGDNTAYFSQAPQGTLTHALNTLVLRSSTASPNLSALKWTVSHGGNLPETGLPAGWQSQDIGWLWGKNGWARFENGRFKVAGAGADIWGTCDAFQYVWHSMPAEGEIIARLVRQKHTHAWAKAGLMIRDGMSCGAKHVFLAATPGHGVRLQHRNRNFWFSKDSAHADVSAPVWLRLVRRGGTITGYTSSDARHWKKVGTVKDRLGGGAVVGLAVTSHNRFRRGKGVFEAVWIKP